MVAGTKIDAVAANNDEMAIGAILALQQAGKDPKKLVIGGIDATKDALREMERGNLAVTVFQDPKAQGIGAVETALRPSLSCFGPILIPWYERSTKNAVILP